MQAAILYGPGSSDAFRIEDVPIPSIGEDDVLVRIAACGVSSRDVVERNGTYRRDVAFPLIMGLEISGVVVKAGSRTLFLVGDHVCSKAFSSCGHCRLCRNGRETTCKERRPVRGGYGEFAAIPAEALVAVPPSYPLVQACVLGPTFGVALNAIRDVTRLTVGESVLVTGASGGVGSAAIQLAKLQGATVIAVTRAVEKSATLLEIGADHVVVAAPNEDFSVDVRALLPDGVDVVIDNVGSAVWPSAFNSLAVHGRYAFVGELTGSSIEINPARIFFKRAQLLGVGSVSRRQLEDVIALAVAGRVVPRITAVMPLADVARAHAIVESGRAVGRVVLSPAAAPVS